MARENMTRDEFAHYLDGFFQWTSHRERSLTSWLLSLEEWAVSEYNAQAEGN